MLRSSHEQHFIHGGQCGHAGANRPFGHLRSGGPGCFSCLDRGRRSMFLSTRRSKQTSYNQKSDYMNYRFSYSSTICWFLSAFLKDKFSHLFTFSQDFRWTERFCAELKLWIKQNRLGGPWNFKNYHRFLADLVQDVSSAIIATCIQTKTLSQIKSNEFQEGRFSSLSWFQSLISK